MNPSRPSLLLNTPLFLSPVSPSSPGSVVCLDAWRGAAVQEERQRIREREEGLECSSAVNEEMPVEKILEAETSVEQRAELHSDAGSAGSSVSIQGYTVAWISIRVAKFPYFPEIVVEGFLLCLFLTQGVLHPGKFLEMLRCQLKELSASVIHSLLLSSWDEYSLKTLDKLLSL